MLLSALLRSYNEEKNIARCLDNLLSFCDEVVISDGGSTDETKFIASQYRDRGFNVEWLDFPEGSISKDVYLNHAGHQLNFGLDHCKGEWVITQDVDLVFCQRVEAHVREILATTTHDAFIMYGVHCVRDENHYSAGFGTGPGMVQLFRNLPDVRFPDMPDHAHHVSDYPWKNLGVMQGGVYHFGYIDREWEMEKIRVRAKAMPHDDAYNRLLGKLPQHDPQPIPWERCNSDCEVCWMEERAKGSSVGVLTAQRDKIVEMLDFTQGNLTAALLLNREEHIERHTKSIANMECDLSRTNRRLKAIRERMG